MDHCGICKEKIIVKDLKTELTRNIDVKCIHRFHNTCMVTWLKKGCRKTCPLCRTDWENSTYQSTNYRYKLYILAFPITRCRNQDKTSTSEQTPVGSNAQSMATAAFERKVWFSDESRFLLQRADGRARVHRSRNERLPPTAFTKWTNC